MNIKSIFSGYSVNDIEAARAFYAHTLGLDAKIENNMGLKIALPEGGHVFIYPKPNHEAASFTVLNLVVDDIDAAVDEITGKGVQMEKYDGFHQDDKGIARSDDPSHGPSIAWFKDPAGNIISIIQA